MNTATRLSLFATVLVALVSGCAGFETITSQTPEQVVYQLSVGDDVRIVTRDGRETRFTIRSIEKDAVVGDNVRIPVADIASVSVKTQSDGSGDEAVTVISSLIGLALGISLMSGL